MRWRTPSLALATPSPLAPALRIIGATDTLGALLHDRYDDKPTSARILLERACVVGEDSHDSFIQDTSRDHPRLYRCRVLR